MTESLLFSPYTLRSKTFRNRLWVAPMAQYAAGTDGVPTDWHLAHLGGMARGGAGLVMTEACAVEPAGRLGPADTGIWNAEQASAWKRITRFISDMGAVPAIQLAHSGRKGCVSRRGVPLPPENGGWQTIAPSALAYEGLPEPHALTRTEIAALVDTFAAAARRSIDAGFEVVEIHAAHGYLINEFLSPLGNDRTDEYGGSFENRCRFLVEIVAAVRAAIPEDVPLFVRISATDWAEDGWTVHDSMELCRLLDGTGVDLMDISSGGMVAHQKITVGPGYQVPFARAVRSAGSIPVAAVGLITEAVQAEQILVDGGADVVMVGRQLLREPHWPYRAAVELRSELRWPAPYATARYRGSIP
ncbi:NADH:flavin oxidoreductase/NADH oxidase [Rhodococcus sp. NPDC003382]|uniref:NADH:flavin oxidoreductase/NADH oxidase n=1 Tax=Rhodococcus sp. HM1 TaxID=2937759 RepID=UPI00200A7CCC|nr:NADH:flavin oxidoreductase/NADH oxidase [Rhodococcus sp. HM1]MCK8669750.1 NADH:flavin oxidoreductase/NADH oxidase [Rhodococcus sp. HM1]